MASTQSGGADWWCVMGETTGIQWCDHTFNPWIGCAKVSSECKNCYAENAAPTRKARANGLELWGVNGSRQVTSDANWRLPLRWNRQAKRDGVRRRVFCASLADVFEDRPDTVFDRARLCWLIEECDALDWLLLTKRPENVMRLVCERWRIDFPSNVWMGTTAGTQETADERIPLLLGIPAAVRFVSAEPLLGPVDFSRVPLDPTNPTMLRGVYNPLTGGGKDTSTPWRIDWVIVGGESGPGARPCRVEWIRSVVRQCKDAGVACFNKQGGASNACVHSRKGGCVDCMPEDLRVREFPEVRR